jgi:hypothetical protein
VRDLTCTWLAGCKLAVAIALGEDLEDGNWVPKGSEEGVDVVLHAEGVPSVPVFVLCLGVLSSDAMVDGFLHKAEIREECICFRSVQSLQGSICGKCKSK